MSRIDEKALAERFEDDRRIQRAMNRAAEFARLRREMWARFRQSIAGEEPKANGAPPPAAPARRGGDEA